MRLACLLLSVFCLTPSLSAAAAYGFSAKEAHPCTYLAEIVTDMEMETAGDTLRFRNWQRWDMALFVKELTEDTCLIEVTFFSIRAGFQRPGESENQSSYQINSNGKSPEERGEDDPLLGNLLAMKDVKLTLHIDPAANRVMKVDGGESIIKAIAKRHPPRTPGEDSPMVSAAKKAYTSERLTALWNEILKHPADKAETVTLGPPLQAQVKRSWTGQRYEVELIPGQEQPTWELYSKPVPVRATLTELTGEGNVVLNASGLVSSAGKTTARFKAMHSTQAVELQVQTNWSFGITQLKFPTDKQDEATPAPEAEAAPVAP